MDRPNQHPAQKAGTWPESAAIVSDHNGSRFVEWFNEKRLNDRHWSYVASLERQCDGLQAQLAATRPKPKRKSALWIFAKKLWPTREVWRVTSITLLFLVPMWFGAYMSVFTELFMTPPEYAKDGDISEGGRIGQWIWGLGLFGSLLWGLLICFVVIPSCQWLVKTWREAKREARDV